MNIRLINNQKGFTLIQAIFILVVLSLLGLMMMRLSHDQVQTSALAMLRARTYQAAHAGMEWAAARAKFDQDCSGTMDFDGVQVSVFCGSETVDEGTGSGTYSVFSIESSAQMGTFGSPDYVARKVTGRIIKQ